MLVLKNKSGMYFGGIKITPNSEHPMGESVSPVFVEDVLEARTYQEDAETVAKYGEIIGEKLNGMVFEVVKV